MGPLLVSYWSKGVPLLLSKEDDTYNWFDDSILKKVTPNLKEP